MTETVAVDRHLPPEKFKIARSVKYISHVTLTSSLGFRVALAAIAHSLVELSVEKKGNEPWDQGDVAIDFHWLPVETIAWFSTTRTCLQLHMRSGEHHTVFDATVVTLCHQLRGLLQLFLHLVQCVKVALRHVLDLHQELIHDSVVVDLQREEA